MLQIHRPVFLSDCAGLAGGGGLGNERRKGEIEE